MRHLVHRTVKFTALYIFVIMGLGTRKVMHINVTQHSTQDWVRQPFDAAWVATELEEQDWW